MAPMHSSIPSYFSLLKFNYTKYPYPTCWNPEDRCGLLNIGHDRMRIEYVGEGKNDGEAASIRADQPIPAQIGVFYYEMSIKNKGRDGFIGIGISQGSVSLVRLPGWEANSFGYHGDDGHFFASSGQGKSYGPTYSIGDVIGCGVHTDDGALFFTKNGQYIGVACNVPFYASTINESNVTSHITNPHHQKQLQQQYRYYPTIGMRTPGEMIQANFGADRFVFDIHGYIKNRKTLIYENILKESSISLTRYDYEQLILHFLIHEGYFETARAFFKLTNNSSQSKSEQNQKDRDQKELDGQLEQSKKRKEISTLVMNGNIQQAYETVLDLYPGIFDDELHGKKIEFLLRCQMFVEMTREMTKQNENASNINTEDVIHFGIQLQKDYGNEIDFQRQLENLFLLMVDENPSQSPVAYLLDIERRKCIVDELMHSVLLHQGKTPSSSYELAIRQILLVLDELATLGSGHPALIDVYKDFLTSKVDYLP